MARSYAIGDIHGHLDKLKAVHALIEQDRKDCSDEEAPVVHIGDLVDRGPDSNGVIQYLIEGLARGENWVVLKGNHDRMMDYYLQDVPRVEMQMRHEYSWLHPRIGGMDTLGSYGVQVDEGVTNAKLHPVARAAVPQTHRDFLAQLPIIYQYDEMCFAHAGIRPGIALEDQVEDDLCWIRKDFHVSTLDHGPLIVHGHTPIDAVTHYGNRINIDTGAGFGKPISVIVIEGRDVWQLTGQGRIKIDAEIG